MEHIREAVERAKDALPVDKPPPAKAALPERDAPSGDATIHATDLLNEGTWLDAARLEDRRIISQEIGDVRAKAIDMLRTQVLQTMDANSWQVLGVTSPTAGCGKSVISLNLALSIARQPERSVLLIDLDIQKPQVADILGLKQKKGILSILAGRSKLNEAVTPAQIRSNKMLVLPCESSNINSSELMASRAMYTMLQELKSQFKSCTVILDLPPLLPSDDVLSILPSVDCILFVAAAGKTTVPQIKESNKYLETVPLVRFVLNKAGDGAAKYYSRYYNSGGSA